MEILKDIRIVDLGLMIGSTLVIGDIHIGYEEAMNKQGVLIPRLQFDDLISRLERLLEEKPETVVINGDLKHEFGKISETEWRHTLRFIDRLSGRRLILIRGNHDKILGPIADKRDIEIADHHLIDDTYILHGDRMPDDGDFRCSGSIVMGHEHPAIGISDGIRTERFKCFLKGRYEDKNLIIMPSFLQVTEGSDVLQKRFISRMAKEATDIEVFVAGKKVLSFGRLEELRKKMRSDL